MAVFDTESWEFEGPPVADANRLPRGHSETPEIIRNTRGMSYSEG
jgi:hypothetical protein